MSIGRNGIDRVPSRAKLVPTITPWRSSYQNALNCRRHGERHTEHNAALFHLPNAGCRLLLNVSLHRERILVTEFSTFSECWDERGIGNLLQVARRAGFDFVSDPAGLTIVGPTIPTELLRLIREQAGGIVTFLKHHQPPDNLLA